MRDAAFGVKMCHHAFCELAFGLGWYLLTGDIFPLRISSRVGEMK
jgi:hypothetical protein